MQRPLKTLAIIPARGGSKGVPRKNLRLLAGRPLIAWTIDLAKACSVLDRVVVSTDDEEIADVALQCGADVPFLRPPQLALDETPDLPVCRHTLQWLFDHEKYTPCVVVWLRPTSPLRTSHDIEEAIRRLSESNADCVRSVCAVEHHPYWMYRLKKGVLLSFMEDVKIPLVRQQLPYVYRANGVVDVVRADKIPLIGALFQGVMHGYVMPSERSMDIDTENDLKLAELLLSGRVIK